MLSPFLISEVANIPRGIESRSSTLFSVAPSYLAQRKKSAYCGGRVLQDTVIMQNYKTLNNFIIILIIINKKIILQSK